MRVVKKAPGQGEKTRVRLDKLLASLSAAVRTAPLTVPVGLAAFGAFAVLCLLAGWFNSWTLLIGGGLLSFLAIRYVHRFTLAKKRPGSDREQRLCDTIAVIGVLLWTVGNIPFASQHIFTDRDPATYAVAGAWLAANDDIRIPEPAAFRELPGVVTNSLGFSKSTLADDEIYAQGSHILPAFLGLSGRLFGTGAMLHTNIIFGAAALLAVYGLGRLLMKPRWALAATVSLSVCLPLIYFSRDMYTEPMALAFIFGSLALLWHAEHSRRMIPWLIAGLTLGAAILARIDTYLPVAAVYGFLLIQLAIAKPTERGNLLRRQLAFAAGVAALGLLAWLDLTQLSSGYYRDLRPQFISEMTLLAVITLGGAGLLAVAWKTDWLQRFDAFSKPWRYKAGLAVLLGFFAFLASRPLWQVNYAMKDGTLVRSYAEYSLVWMTWYLGPVLAILGLAGIVMVGARLLHGRLMKTLPAMSVIAICLYYLINPNISSDQVWASRRFLPVILPGLALLGFFILSKLYEKKPFTIRGLPLNPQVCATALATLAIIGPLFVSFPFLVTRTYAPQLSQVEFICDTVPDNAAVVWVGSARDTSMQPVQAFCGVPSFGIDDEASLTDTLPGLIAAAREAGVELVMGVRDTEAGALPESIKPYVRQENSIAFADLEQTYKKFPRNRVVQNQTILLGSVMAFSDPVPAATPTE